MNKVINYFKDLKTGFLILCNKKFWKDFFEYYSAENIARRLDRFIKEGDVIKTVGDKGEKIKTVHEGNRIVTYIDGKPEAIIGEFKKRTKK